MSILSYSGQGEEGRGGIRRIIRDPGYFSQESVKKSIAFSSYIPEKHGYR